MEKFTIYPAIDLRGGTVVRLSQGKPDQQTDYSNSPSFIAEKWIREGAEWLHIVNLDGAFSEDSRKNADTIQAIIKDWKDKIRIQIGGGLRTTEQISAALELGVTRVVLGTAVIENPAFGETVLEIFGGDRIVFGFDAMDQELMSRGWQSPSGVKILPLGKRLANAGARTVIYTNILKDGMQTGVDWENAKILADQTGLDVIASGGTTNLADIRTVRKAGLNGVVVGRALYEGNFTLEEALNVS